MWYFHEHVFPFHNFESLVETNVLSKKNVTDAIFLDDENMDQPKTQDAVQDIRTPLFEARGRLP